MKYDKQIKQIEEMLKTEKDPARRAVLAEARYQCTIAQIVTAEGIRKIKEQQAKADAWLQEAME